MSKGVRLCFLVLFYTCHSMASTLEFEWQHYISEPVLETQLDDYLIIKWDQKTDVHLGAFYFNSHIQTEYNLDKSKMFYFNVPELYFLYKHQLAYSLYSVNSVELAVGRKIKDWSLADAYWEMDLWNSVSRTNPLHPNRNGLVGSFLTLKARRWSVDFLVGALHFPNQEPKMIQKGVEFSSPSRWFSPLPDRVNLWNSSIDIHYFIKSPFVFDILLQQSYLLSLKTWSKTAGTYYWVKGSIADKPVNHLFSVLNTKDIFNIGNTEGAEGNIQQFITSLPVRQRLLSLEWGVDYDSLSAVFTLENTKMKEVETSPEGWDFFNSRESFTYFSALLKYNFLPKSFVRIGYLQSWFQNYNVRAEAFRKEQTSPSILTRYKLLDGVSFDCQMEFLSSTGLPRLFALKYRYSFLNKGAWLFAKVLYYLTPDVHTSMTFDILGAKREGNYFLNQFAHNDYFSWRLTYEF